MECKFVNYLIFAYLLVGIVLSSGGLRKVDLFAIQDFNHSTETTLSQYQTLEDERMLESNRWISQFKMYGGIKRNTSDGDLLVEGDIVIPKNDESEDELSPRKATSNPFVIWPKKLVVYQFHFSVPRKLKLLIEEAIEHWRENTCLRFEKRRNDHFWFWYLTFTHKDKGCWSRIGNVLFTAHGQDVSIGVGCEDRNVIIHEIGHAIGFFHEHSRRDRDNEVYLLSENIQRGMEPQFFKSMDKNYNVPFDLKSVMLYPKSAFSVSPFEKNTMVTRNPHNQRLMGRSNGLSFRDKKMVSQLYQCSEKCTNLNNVTCENQGYLKPFRDQLENCSCECPRGTSGEFCETTEGGYYDDPTCGKNVTEPEIIETPNYPQRQNPYEDCSWWIQAPTGKKVQVEFLDFSFESRMNVTGHPFDEMCAFESVEIRKDRYHGQMYCGQDISPGQTITSESNEFVIIIYANKDKVGRGLQANVTFV